MSSAEDRMEKKILTFLANSPRREYSFESLYSNLQRPPPTTLAAGLAHLTTTGKIRRLYRVISPDTGIGIGDFQSIFDVPDNIYDDTSGHVVTVDPEKNLKILYRGEE
ncbi:hypothetical protein [Ensifer adhaerens]|uniref:hypothetical protein n=1 Tax=Ensifer adhaerens TaxID=106592 RepID=UPI001C4DDAEF|nr:hypothetical protein [Ensifer adhaerens]MBW0370580.1 hypothetical protein [Ensifer adhaerens]UCM21600.1 hypothetical protein LDL63_08490 [Ensifer adhaerens]